MNLMLVLRQRLKAFYSRNSCPRPPRPADQAAPLCFVGLRVGATAFAGRTRPSEELPGGVLECSTLRRWSAILSHVRIDERLASYVHAYQVEGDRLRAPAAEMGAIGSVVLAHPADYRGLLSASGQSPDKKRRSVDHLLHT